MDTLVPGMEQGPSTAMGRLAKLANMGNLDVFERVSRVYREKRAGRPKWANRGRQSCLEG